MNDQSVALPNEISENSSIILTTSEKQLVQLSFNNANSDNAKFEMPLDPTSYLNEEQALDQFECVKIDETSKNEELDPPNQSANCSNVSADKTLDSTDETLETKLFAEMYKQSLNTPVQ